jgi:hypothetical protein
MPGQSGASEINEGKLAINRGRACDPSPQVINVTTGDVGRFAMKKMVLPIAVAVLLGFGATALSAAESGTGPSGFPAATESANSKGKTGDSADCPIKKTFDGKTFCFQNDPALTKPQGGH